MTLPADGKHHLPVSPRPEFSELRKRWIAARSIIHRIPPFEEVILGSLGRMSDQLVLLAASDADWTILSVGGRIGERIAGAQRGARVADLEPDIAGALADMARHATNAAAPHSARAYFARDGFVQCYDILALPLDNRWGLPFVAVFLVEAGPRYSLIDAVFRSTGDGILAFAVIRDENNDPIDFQIVDNNQRAAEMLGETMQSIRWRRLSTGAHAMNSPEVAARLKALLDDGQEQKFEIASTSGGSALHLSVGLTRMGDLICASLSDVSGIRLRERSYRLLFDDNPMPMWIVDRDSGAIAAVNDAAVRHAGYAREDLLDARMADICAGSDDHRHIGAHAEAAPHDEGARSWTLRRADGTTAEVLAYERPIDHQGRSSRLVALVDITKRKQAEDKVAFLARHDALTGLHNRTHYHEAVENRIAAHVDNQRVLGVCFVDLDRFKDVNDSHGHPVGDQLLRIVADRLRGVLRSTDVIARNGGDEFAILLTDMDGKSDIGQSAARVIEALSRPYVIEGINLTVGASIGVAVYPGDGHSADELLKSADMALYQAKAEGGGRHHFFHADLELKAKTRRALEDDLRSALNAGQLELHYQPFVGFAERRVVGFEALMRWRHPDRGLIPPSEFIPVAEASGLIVPLGEWALHAACIEAMRWPSHLTVAVNLSPLQFRSRKLVSAVESALSVSGLDPRRLELEITESALLAETESTLATLRRLKSLGIRFSMDDFGTGFSSLSYLRAFPFEKIKIDRSFVKELAEGGESMAIVCAIANLAKSIGMATTAEGVETPEQLQILAMLGCDVAQGFLFSPARPASDLPALIEKIDGSSRLAA